MNIYELEQAFWVQNEQIELAYQKIHEEEIRLSDAGKFEESDRFVKIERKKLRQKYPYYVNFKWDSPEAIHEKIGIEKFLKFCKDKLGGGGVITEIVDLKIDEILKEAKSKKQFKREVIL